MVVVQENDWVWLFVKGTPEFEVPVGGQETIFEIYLIIYHFKDLSETLAVHLIINFWDLVHFL